MKLRFDFNGVRFQQNLLPRTNVVPVLNLIVKVEVINLVIDAGIFLSLNGIAFGGQEKHYRIASS